MKKLIYVVLLSSIANANTLDLHTDAACASLKQAIEHAQPIEKIQEAWHQTLAQGTHSKFETVKLATQTVAYAQEQKEKFEALSNKTYDVSKLAWGGIKTTASLWCIAGSILYWSTRLNNYDPPCSRPLFEKLTCVFLPDVVLTESLPKQINKIILITKKSSRDLFLYPALTIARLGAAAWLLYTGIPELTQGFTYKKIVTEKIKNLTAAIEFIHPWTDPVLVITPHQFEDRNWEHESIPA